MSAFRSERLPEFQHLSLDGGLEKLRGIGDSDFLHHIRPVGLDRFYADF